MIKTSQCGLQGKTGDQPHQEVDNDKGENKKDQRKLEEFHLLRIVIHFFTPLSTKQKEPPADDCTVVPVYASGSNAPARTRTLNPLIKSQMLCQLSYRGDTDESVNSLS